MGDVGTSQKALDCLIGKPRQLKLFKACESDVSFGSNNAIDHYQFINHIRHRRIIDGYILIIRNIIKPRKDISVCKPGIGGTAHFSAINIKARLTKYLINIPDILGELRSTGITGY